MNLLVVLLRAPVGARVMKFQAFQIFLIALLRLLGFQLTPDFAFFPPRPRPRPVLNCLSLFPGPLGPPPGLSRPSPLSSFVSAFSQSIVFFVSLSSICPRFLPPTRPPPRFPPLAPQSPPNFWPTLHALDPGGGGGFGRVRVGICIGSKRFDFQRKINEKRRKTQIPKKDTFMDVGTDGALDCFIDCSCSCLVSGRFARRNYGQASCCFVDNLSDSSNNVYFIGALVGCSHVSQYFANFSRLFEYW